MERKQHCKPQKWHTTKTQHTYCTTYTQIYISSTNTNFESKGRTGELQLFHTLTCGFDLARFSILIQASSRSFDLAFSLLNKAPNLVMSVFAPPIQVQHYFSWSDVAGCNQVSVRRFKKKIHWEGEKSCAYLFFSALNCCVQSSKSFWFISMKSFRAL